MSHDAGQRLAAGGFDLFDGAVDRAGQLGCGSAVFATTAMLAPSRAARSAIALPMPRLAPVMNSVLPSRLAMGREGYHGRRASPVPSC